MNQKRVIVTGGGRGIGRAVCERFARDGAQVMSASRTQAELDETRRAILQRGGRCETHRADVTSAADVKSLIATTIDRFGGVDVLVNCAGVAPRASIEDLDATLFDTILSTNARAVYLGCHAAWPVMKRQGEGVIVNISSIASVDPFPGFTAYGAAKAWVNAWSKGLAAEGRGAGIRVFCVAPGAVETAMLRGPFPDFPKDQTLNPSHVADVVCALCQPDCRYATGQTVFVQRQGD